MHHEINLTPVQYRAAEALKAAARDGGILVLRGSSGSGKSAVLQWLHSACGGALLPARKLMGAAGDAIQYPELTFLRLIEESMERHDLVLVDDLHLVAGAVQRHRYPSSHILDASLTAILAEAGVRKKTFVFAVEDEAPFPIRRRASVWEIG